MKMNAAVVTSFGEPPGYREFDVPQPQSADQILVDVLAAGCTRGSARVPPGRITPAPARCR